MSYRACRLFAWPVALAALCIGPMPAAFAADFDCLIEPSQLLEIRSPVNGLIERVHVERGSVVKRGAVLITLDSTVERAAAELSRFRSTADGLTQSAESRLAHANRKLRRRADLAERNYMSVQDRDDAEAEQSIAQADALTARENKQLAKLEFAYASAQLAQRTIRSPIDGVVTEQAQHAGELAEAGDNKPPILKLAQTHPLRVKLILPVFFYSQVKPGMQAEVTPEKPLGGRFVATVGLVDKVIDAASGTFQVRMELPNPSAALPGGLKCKAKLALQMPEPLPRP
jgi:RND family efflux transporter MFP subunit